MYVRKIYHS